MVDVKVIGYYIFNICPHNRNKLQLQKKKQLQKSGSRIRSIWK